MGQVMRGGMSNLQIFLIEFLKKQSSKTTKSFRHKPVDESGSASFTSPTSVLVEGRDGEEGEDALEEVQASR